MGMHFAAIGIKAAWPALFGALSQSFGRFRELGPVTDMQKLPFGRGDDGIIVGEHCGACFVIDDHMVLSSCNYDELVEISRRLGTLLVACIGETVSGSFGLLVADKGQVVRFYWHCQTDLEKPLEMGTPVASESTSPLDDVDGKGLFDAMRCLGMDFEAWYRHGTKQAYLWEFDETNAAVLKSDGPIGRAQAEHHKKFGLPEDRQLMPTVVSRRMPDGSMGFDIVAGAPSAQGKSLVAKVWLWFRSR